MTNLSQDLGETSKKNNGNVLLKKFFKHFGYEKIVNELGQVIGKVELPLLRSNKNLKILDIINNKEISIIGKNNLFYKTQQLENYSNEIVAKIRLIRIPFFNSKIIFFDKKEKRKYVAIGDFKNWNYKIIDISNNVCIAKLKLPKLEKFIPQNLKLRLNDYYSLQIFNMKIEKIKIISFAICITNFYSSISGISNVAGFERQIARLRPFGPGRSLN
jgi:hypothetical protein